MTTFEDAPAIARQAAAAIRGAFLAYRARFAQITRRGRDRFETRDWHGSQRDAKERLELYSGVIGGIVADITALLADRLTDKTLWSRMKADYTPLIADCHDLELAETFFNSVTRRIFATVGVDPQIEYVHSDAFDEGLAAIDDVCETFAMSDNLVSLIREILDRYAFDVPYRDVELDAKLVAGQIEARRSADWGDEPIECIELVRPVFYRGPRAYIAGRALGPKSAMPLTLSLVNEKHGVEVDAALVTEDDVSVIFSFTRSYFHVELDRPQDMILFLKSIMPRKPIAELYITLGYNKHGKTEMYRNLLNHLDGSTDKFEIAPGDRGLVMVVFTLPSYDVVFKVIRDRFDPPKTITRPGVMKKYQLVFKHDRAGRLVDAQEFEHLQFPRDRFSDALLEELNRSTASSVNVTDEFVDIKHLYAERRIRPLNLYVRREDENAAKDAILDYGQSIKDLAATNIFPGDLLLKNFGVTRHGRVIFYDYDELCSLDVCNFRDMPPPRDDVDEMRDEPWFYVGENDVFPEEFIQFLGLTGALRQSFLDHHGDLLTAAFWKGFQTRHAAGEIIDIRPYPDSRRLRATL